MKAIWKYTVPIQDVFSFSMPDGAQVLTVQMQDGLPQLWAVVDTDNPCVDRWFRLGGTGHPLGDDGLRYIGTVQLDGGALVFHLFEIEASGDEGKGKVMG